MKNLLLRGALALALVTAVAPKALAQCTGVFASGNVCANSTAGTSIAASVTVSALFDRVFGSTQDRILYRSGAGWAATLSLPAAVQIAVGSFNSGTNASASTYLRGDGTWQPVSAGTITVGTTTVASGTSNGILFNTGGVLGNTAAAANSVLATNGSSVPALTATLPTAVQDNITRVGTITSGTWNGTILGLPYGGTNANLTASNGGLVYSTASALAILSGTATAGQIPRSGASAAPSWSTATYPATAAQGTILNAGSANALSATATPTLGVPGSLLGSLGFAGNTSGTALITPQATAGSPTLILPNTSGTFAVGATTPLVLSATTGGLTCPTCVTSSGGGAISGTAPIAVSAAGVVSINAPYVTLTASNGGIVYSGAANLAVLAGTATANQHLQSGSSTTPSWTTNTWPSTATAGTILNFATANTGTATATPTLGANGGTGGQITLNGSTSGSAAIRVAAAAGTATIFQLPANNGTNTYLLQTDGSGNTSWVAPAGTGTVTSVAFGAGFNNATITTSGTVLLCQPDIQYKTSGTAATYTTPTCNGSAASVVRVVMCGPGGGGAGSGTSLNAGSAGSAATTVTDGTGTLTAGVGAGASASVGGGAGGVASVSGSGSLLTAVDLLDGQPGGGISGISPTTATPSPSGAGGNSTRGGAGNTSGTAAAGTAAKTNSCSGGAGGGSSASVNAVFPGAGGGAGATIEAYDLTPAASYTYTIGTGGANGAAGTSGFAGGSGAAGWIKFEARWN